MAENSSVLQIVFSLSPGQLEKINEIDESINRCHFIEIPALSKRQCAQYLQNLSANPANQIDIKRITPGLVDQVYAETTGVPGKILAFIANNSMGTKRFTDKFVLFVAAVLLVAIIGYTMMTGLSETNIGKDKESIEQVVYLKRDVLKTNDQGASEIFDAQTLSIQTQTSQDDILNVQSEKVVEFKDAVDVKTEQLSFSVNASTKVFSEKRDTRQEQRQLASKDAIPIGKSSELLAETRAENKLDNELFDRQWILNQPDSNYTLQLIVLSNLNKAIALKKEHESAEFDIILFRNKKNSVNRYILLSGSFIDPKQAKQVSEKLPQPFQQSWLRKLGSIKKEL